MEKIDAMLARVAAMEIMLTALAAAAPNKPQALARFDQARILLEGHLLNSRATEEFVVRFQDHVQQQRALLES